jgi:hypothetical protein
MACRNCGAQEIIDAVHVSAKGEADYQVRAVVYTKPEALMFKGKVAHPLLARVCVECGHVELFVHDIAGFVAEATHPRES